MSSELASFLKEQVAEVCGIEVDTVSDDAKLVGLGLDSVRLVDLMIAVEEEYDIELDEQDPALARVKTTRDLIDYVSRKV
ncbi:MAG: acyl carrier protein [Deltaproteobacteria bacterium]|nr:MAG: acyl carrier protein [Deltaproteobacteria bacterium]